MHHAIDIDDPDVLALRTHRDQKIETRYRRGSGAGGDDLDVFKILAIQQQRIGDRGGDDDGGTMLIVVKHRDLHARLELRLDLEAFRTLDVLEVDAAECRLQRGHGVDDGGDGHGGDLQVKTVG